MAKTVDTAFFGQVDELTLSENNMRWLSAMKAADA
jgi:hypothetical protein